MTKMEIKIKSECGSGDFISSNDIKVMTKDGKQIPFVVKLNYEAVAGDYIPICILKILCPDIEVRSLAKFELDEEYEKLTSEFSKEELAKRLIELRKDYIRLLNEETNRQLQESLNLQKEEKEIIFEKHYENSNWSETGEIK